MLKPKKYTIVKDNEDKINFINKLIKAIKNINANNICNKDGLENIIQIFTECTNKIWFKHSKIVNITKYSKAWWDENCCTSLENYRHSKKLENWKVFKSIVKKTKCEFFDLKIQEIANKNCRLWKLMD